jgi:NAD(P)H-hydrate repair Nnr-like enzyme with NAD(P)H-hydrate dehydratase domain
MATDASVLKPEPGHNASWADETFARSVCPRRKIGTHKWEVGGVIVIAGSPSFIGAAYLASRAAGRSGAGIVYLASGRSVVVALAGAMPEVAHIVLPETDAPGSARRAVERLEPHLRKAKSVVIGPGLGDDELTDHLLSALFGFGGKTAQIGSNIGFGGPRSVTTNTRDVENSPVFSHEHLKLVIDADALTWLSRQDEWWTHMPQGRAVLTPHPGEMARLTGRSTEEVVADSSQIAHEHAVKWGQAVLMKSAYSAASDGKATLVAQDAPASLATAGTGDVLSGTIGAFLAQGLAPLDASGLALFAGAKAARALEHRFGELGVIATDMPDEIAGVLGKLHMGDDSR